MTETTQGYGANQSGRFLESVVESVFKAAHVPVFDYGHQKEEGHLFEECFLLRNAPYESIYGCKSRSEFLFRHFRSGVDLRIECKNQEQPGSVDEKFPYVLQNAIKVKEHNVLIVLGGRGPRTPAINWLKREATRVATKSITVCDIVDVRPFLTQYIKQVA